MWANWVNVVVGIWLIISPFVIKSASGMQWNNIIFGIVVAVLAYYATTQKK